MSLQNAAISTLGFTAGMHYMIELAPTRPLQNSYFTITVATLMGYKFKVSASDFTTGLNLKASIHGREGIILIRIKWCEYDITYSPALPTGRLQQHILTYRGFFCHDLFYLSRVLYIKNRHPTSTAASLF